MKGKSASNLSMRDKLVKAKPEEAKTVAQLVYTCSILRSARYCKACLGQCEFEDTPTFLGKWVSEAEHTIAIEKLKDEKNVKIDELRIALIAHKVEIHKLEGENKELKAVRDALGRSNKRALADRNTYIKRAEILEGKLEESEGKNVEYAKLVAAQAEEYAGRLEAIRQHYKKRPIPQNFIAVNDWLVELGVLVSEPEKAQKIEKPMWKCPCCKPNLWFGDLNKLKEHVQDKHPEMSVGNFWQRTQPKSEARP